MSLSARIAVGPSRRLEIAAAVLAVGGLVVATTTVLARWPGALVPVVAIVVSCVVAGVALHRRRDHDAFAMTVSDRAEVALAATSPDAGDADWRLTGSTLAWPGFVVVALRRDDGPMRKGATRIRPLLDRDLAPHDRRALRRFLAWSLRGGAGIDRPSAPPSGRR